MKVSKYLKEKFQKNSSSDQDSVSKNGYVKKRKLIVTVCIFAFISLMVIVLIKINATPNNSNDAHPQGYIDYSSYFYNKYDMFSRVKIHAKSIVGTGIEFYYPEISGEVFIDAKVYPNGNGMTIHYENYAIYIKKIPKDVSDSRIYELEYIYKSNKKFTDKLEYVEFNDIRYLVLENSIIYFNKDGYAFEISATKESFTNIKKVIDEVKLVKYEFVGNDTARCEVYDETKTMNYSLNGIESELSYKCKEINYVLGIEYNVYTDADGVNEYMFDNEGKLIGYTLNNTIQEVNVIKDGLDIANEVINKYTDRNLFTLKSEGVDEKGLFYYEYMQDKDGLHTNGIVKITIDKNGNTRNLFFYESKVPDQVPSVNEDLLEKKIKETLNKNLGLLKINDYKLEDRCFSIDQHGDLIIMCNVNVNLQKEYTANTGDKDLVIIGPVDETLIISVKVKDVVN